MSNETRAEKAVAAAKAKAAANSKAKAKGKKRGPAQYFRELKAELKKVVWPSRKQVLNNTGVVLTLMILVGVFLAGIDLSVGAIIELLFKIGN